MKIEDCRKAVHEKVPYHTLENGSVFMMDCYDHLYMTMPQFVVKGEYGKWGPPCNVWDLSTNAGLNIPVDRKVIPLAAVLTVSHPPEESVEDQGK